MSLSSRSVSLPLPSSSSKKEVIFKVFVIVSILFLFIYHFEELTLLVPSTRVEEVHEHAMHHEVGVVGGVGGIDAEELEPPNLPMVEILDLEARKKIKQGRGDFYLGGEDPVHLGGFIMNDSWGFEPHLWRWMRNGSVERDRDRNLLMQQLEREKWQRLNPDNRSTEIPLKYEELEPWGVQGMGAETFLDVGCGRGLSSEWWIKSGGKALCVEGSHHALQLSLVPNVTVEHDYTRGAWYPAEMYDIVWSVEFVEHIDERYIDNYIATFKRGEYVFISHAVWGGYHHATVHDSWWWIGQMERRGFRYAHQLTEKTRSLCVMCSDTGDYKETGNGRCRGNSHYKYRGLAFYNMHFDEERKRRIKASPTRFDHPILEKRKEALV